MEDLPVEVGLLAGDEELPAKCSFCNCRFANETDLEVHSASHQESPSEKNRKCSECNRVFSCKKQLTRHIKSVHLQEKPYKCTICEKSYSASVLLTAHYNRHNGIKPFQCSVCEKSFTLKLSLTRHLTVHSSEKPFKCELCPKSFTEKKGLLYHLRNHIGEKPFKCELCDKCFNSKVVLQTHARRFHEVEVDREDFICNNCGRAFFQKSDLTRHIQIHNTVASHECTTCGDKFITKQRLRKHFLKHSKPDSKCTICDKECRSLGYLKRHSRVHLKVKTKQKKSI